MSRVRIAILAHSTNPRGGVVHALELGDALKRLGHDATVFAPDVTGAGFFRPTLCATIAVPASPVERDIASMVQTRVADYVRYFERAENRRFDIWHAQDGISANALATLKKRGLINGFASTVHHVDSFADERLRALQLRAMKAADQLFVVGNVWRDWLARELKREAHCVGNGVDQDRFSPVRDETDAKLRAQFNLPASTPVFLALGGIEERKNAVRLLQAFQSVWLQRPTARLLIAGGASLLDHSAYRARFAGMLAHGGASAAAVIRTGPLRQRLMPALYRAATTLVCASVKEGFGLVVLEAMASGIPVVVSRLAPFTEYLSDDDALWCDPFDTASIADAMLRSLDVERRPHLIARGMEVAARHDWNTVARRHVGHYEKLREAVVA